MMRQRFVVLLARQFQVAVAERIELQRLDSPSSTTFCAASANASGVRSPVYQPLA